MLVTKPKRRFGSYASAVLLILLAYSVTGPAVAEKKHDFERWEKTISAFEEQDRKEPPAKGGVLFVGSSSIRQWDLKKSFPGREMINRGFGGSEIVDSIHFADRIILKHRPRIVVLYAGDNDIAHDKTAKQVHRDYQRFVKTIHERLPRTKIVFVAIKPSIKRWSLADTMSKANGLISNDCQGDERLEFADVWKPMLDETGRPRQELFVKDGLHLNEKGYELWSSILAPYLANGLGE